MGAASPVDSGSDVTVLHQGLIDQLKEAGHLRTPRIEAAFRAIPRHLFLPGVPVQQVYTDQAIVTKQQENRGISSSSQPAVMVIMLEQLDLRPGHRVLEIGAGTGYNAAVMAHIVGDTGRVTTIDIDEEIVEQARERLAGAGFGHVDVLCRDGGYGYADAAPYDRIILTVGSAEITPAWREQLKPGGRLLLPLAVTEGGLQKTVAFEPSGDCLVSISIKDCAFMPLRGAFAMTVSDDRRVLLGPEPGLQLHLKGDDDRVIDAEGVYKLLTGPGRDLPTGVEVTPLEMGLRFFMWLGLHGPDPEFGGLGCSLLAEGEMATRGIVPYLFGFWGKHCSTGGLLREGSMAVWMRPPDQRPRQQWVKDEPPFELFVRSYGPDEALARHLIEQVRGWDAAGRPPDQARLRIRAYPKETGDTRSTDQVVIERQYTRLVIDW